MFTVNDFVYFPFKGATLHGKIVAITGDRASVEYFSPTKEAYTKVSKPLGKLTPGRESVEYEERAERNAIALQGQDTPLESWIIYQGDPRFNDYLEPLENALEIGLDLETLGYSGAKGALHPLHGDIRLIQVWLPSKEVCLVWDLGEIEKNSFPRPQGLKNAFGFYDLDLIPGGRSLVKVLANSNCRKWIHNAAFESLWINHCFGIQLTNVRDVMIMSQMFWAGMHRGIEEVGLTGSNTLKWVAFRLHLGVIAKDDQLWDYGFAIGNRQINYAGLDAKITVQCGHILEKKMQKIGMVQCHEAECRAIPAFGQMSYMGFPVNPFMVREFVERFRDVLAELKTEWDSEFPGISPTSSQQAAPAIKERYNVNLGKTNPKGQIVDSIAYEILAPYFETVPILRTLASIGSVSTGLVYLENIERTMRPNPLGINAVYGQFRQLASPGSMGRSGCGGTDPWVQLQTPPKGSSEWARLGLPKIRGVFEAPKGYSIISFDLSGSHAQIARYMSQDPKLLEALEKNIKVHFYTSQGILKVQGIHLEPLEIMAIKKDETHPLYPKIAQAYEDSKTAFYSSLNGGGATRLQGSFAESDPPIVVPLETCEGLIQGTKAAYPGMFGYMNSLPRQAEKKNHVIPLWVDDCGKPYYWGYWGSVAENKAAPKLIRPPGLTDEETPKYVGQRKGKYSGYLPGKIRFYGELRSPDGGRYFLQKEPDRKGRYQCLMGDATAFMWQRLEKTGIADACGILTETFQGNPEWNAWIPSFLHDELMVIFKTEYAEIIAPLVCQTVVESMRKVIPDFTTEVTNPMATVKSKWEK